jgi:hypothetical protein
MQLSPAQIIDEIDDSRRRLQGYGADYSTARHQLAADELNYQRELGKLYISLLDPDFRKTKGLEKLPAEDMRKQIAHNMMGENIWAAYLKSEADVEALDKLIRVEQSNLTGLQSELQQLRVEYQNT